MQTRNLITSLMLIISFNSFANEEIVVGDKNSPSSVAAVANSPEVNGVKKENVNTFNHLLDLQGQAAASEIQAKIRINNNAGLPSGKNGAAEPEAAPVNANPLLNASQRLVNSEPTLEAIWGLSGREVAEINYKGQRMAVSMRSPIVSKEDGWVLEEIQPFQVVLVQRKGKKGVVNRKEIPLNWQGHIGGVYSAATPAVAAPVVPSFGGMGNRSYPSFTGPSAPSGVGRVNQASTTN